MRERVKFDIPAVHAESNHITSKQCHCQSLTFYPRNESPHMVHRQHADVWSGFVVGIQQLQQRVNFRDRCQKTNGYGRMQKQLKQ